MLPTTILIDEAPRCVVRPNDMKDLIGRLADLLDLSQPTVAGGMTLIGQNRCEAATSACASLAMRTISTVFGGW